MEESFITTDLIECIRAYQIDHPELLKSHHFVFDCPLDHTYKGRPRLVWMGINPGDDEDDWARLPENMEESRDYDFQVAHGRSDGSTKRLRKLKTFVGRKLYRKMTHSQWFFWASTDTRKKFDTRYGYSLEKNPHWAFCCDMNRILIYRARPIAVLAEGRRFALLNADRLGLQRGPEHKNAKGETLIEEWQMDGEIPFYAFDHLSARGKSIRRRPEVRERLLVILQCATAPST